MLPNLDEYYRPTTVNAALRLLARGTTRTVALAGGTALIPSRDASVRAVVDLSELNLAGADWEARPVRLGAMTTLQTLTSDPAARVFANGILAEAARLCAPRNIRNVATIGGTVVSGGATCDLLTALLALDAQVTVQKNRPRTAAIDDLLEDRSGNLGAGILTSVSLPVASTACGAALLRVARTPSDAAIVNAAALIVLDGAVCKRVRLAIGGVSTRAIRAASIESEMEGLPWDDARAARAAELFAASLAPPGDFRASSQYRREMAAVVALRSLRRAWACAQGVL